MAKVFAIALLLTLTAGACMGPESKRSEPKEPDPGVIAFASNEAGTFDIYLLDLSSNEVQRFISLPAYDSDPAWSPDGCALAFVSDREGTNDIYLWSSKEPLRNLSKNPANDKMPNFSRDGKYVFFASDRSGDFDIYRVDVRTEVTEVLLAGSGFQGRPTAAPDDQMIAYVSEEGGTQDLLLLDLSTDKRIKLTTDGAPKVGIAWNPTGTALVYGSRQSGDFDLYSFELASRQTRRMTQSLGFEGDPSWVGQDDSIAFARELDSKNVDLFLINHSDLSTRPLTSTPHWEALPAWSIRCPRH